LQSYVGFDVLTKTASATQNLGYDDFPVQRRALSEILSSVTVRNYNL